MTSSSLQQLADMKDFFISNSADIIIFILYLIIAVIISLVTTYANRKLWLQEVAKDQVLLSNINIYRQMGIKVSVLKQEALQTISGVAIKVTDMRQDGRSDMQILDELEKNYDPSALLYKVSTLKNDCTYFSNDMIQTIKELEEVFWDIFKNRDLNQFRKAKKITELTDTLLNQIRKNTCDVMSRKKEFWELISEAPVGGYATRMEIEAGNELENVLGRR